ncbi:MAG: hypothetical protein LBV52_05630 [Spirochaetaceae bacterium]|nr:hypothetical protein [Spirochaetaceae bacterium]
MKPIASLIAYFGIFFTLIFLGSVSVGFLHVWITAVSTVPMRPYLGLAEIVQKVEWALPFSLYLTIIFSMNYANRHKTPPAAAFLIVVVMSGAFVWGASKGLSNSRKMAAPPFLIQQQTIGKQGLILSQSGTVFTLLDDPAIETGSRVVSIPDKPLIYQELPVDANGNVIPAPPIPFHFGNSNTFATLQDLTLSAQNFSKRYDQGLSAFGMWALALILLLCALSFIFEIGEWHIANIFLGIFLFRGLLAFEVFFNSAEIQNYLFDFFRGALRYEYISPFVFTVIAALILIYVVLYFIAQGKKSNA